MNESDLRSDVHYLGSSENKAWKKVRPDLFFIQRLVYYKILQKLMLSQSFILKTDETTLVGSNQSNYKHCALIRCILRCGMVMGSFVHQVKYTKIPNISKRLLIKSLKQTNICNFNSNGSVCPQLILYICILYVSSCL